MAKTLYELCRYQFSNDELRVLGVQLAREAQDAIALKEERATVVADYAARLKEASRRVAEFSHKLNCGYEMRDTECIVMMDSPRPGTKTIVRVDTGEAIREELMAEDERQGALFPDSHA
jgi:hypothetical protein